MNNFLVIAIVLYNLPIAILAYTFYTDVYVFKNSPRIIKILSIVGALILYLTNIFLLSIMIEDNMVPTFFGYSPILRWIMATLLAFLSITAIIFFIFSILVIIKEIRKRKNK